MPNDLCPDDDAKTSPGACGCGVSDRDEDGNGVPDCLTKVSTSPWSKRVVIEAMWTMQ